MFLVCPDQHVLLVTWNGPQGRGLKAARLLSSTLLGLRSGLVSAASKHVLDDDAAAIMLL